MRLAFSKMHGLGNDYIFIFVTTSDQEIPVTPELVRRLSDRHRGIGSDGLILVHPPRAPENDCRMEMYNADGSRSEMCGNGIRCVGRLLHERGIARRETLRVETDAGVRALRLHLSPEGDLKNVAVDMGPPGLRRRDVPLVDGGAPEEPAIAIPVDLDGRSLLLTGVSMGNPHAVLRVDDPSSGPPVSLDDLPVETWGPRLERHSWFPRRTNVEFVRVRSPSELELRVWERGSGETLACGTGACAAVVAGVVGNWCERRVTVHLRGGELDVECRDEPGGSVWMTGPAVEVFRGEVEL